MSCLLIPCSNGTIRFCTLDTYQHTERSNKIEISDYNERVSNFIGQSKSRKITFYSTIMILFGEIYYDVADMKHGHSRATYEFITTHFITFFCFADSV